MQHRPGATAISSCTHPLLFLTFKITDLFSLGDNRVKRAECFAQASRRQLATGYISGGQFLP